MSRETRLDIFPCVLHDTRKRKHVKEYLRMVGCKDKPTDSVGYVQADQHMETGDLHILIFINEKRINAHPTPEVELVRTYCHEAVHAAAAVLEQVGESLDGETMAYLTEWIFAWLMKGS